MFYNTNTIFYLHNHSESSTFAPANKIRVPIGRQFNPMTVGGRTTNATALVCSF